MLRIASRALDDAFAKFPTRVRPQIQIRGYRVSAGMAYYRHNVIGLSRTVLQTDEQVRETTLHEYAHLLAVHRCGARAANHGPDWKQAMLDLGLEPKVRHNLPVQRNTKRRRVVYTCRKCQIEIIRSRRLNARRKYYHVKCGGEIRLTRIEES